MEQFASDFLFFCVHEEKKERNRQMLAWVHICWQDRADWVVTLEVDHCGWPCADDQRELIQHETNSHFNDQTENASFAIIVQTLKSMSIQTFKASCFTIAAFMWSSET